MSGITSESLSLYLITWEDNDPMCDSYDECIVIAPNERVALNTHPNGIGTVKEGCNYQWVSDDTKDELNIVKIGNIDRNYYKDEVKSTYEDRIKNGCGYVVTAVFNYCGF